MVRRVCRYAGISKVHRGSPDSRNWPFRAVKKGFRRRSLRGILSAPTEGLSECCRRLSRSSDDFDRARCRVQPFGKHLLALARSPRSILASSGVALKMSKPDTGGVRSNPEPEKAHRVHRIVVPTYPVGREHRTASVHRPLDVKCSPRSWHPLVKLASAACSSSTWRRPPRSRAAGMRRGGRTRSICRPHPLLPQLCGPAPPRRYAHKLLRLLEASCGGSLSRRRAHLLLICSPRPARVGGAHALVTRAGRVHFAADRIAKRRQRRRWKRGRGRGP
jgi:hypothetical protein